MKLHFSTFAKHAQSRGFVLPLTLMVCVIILTIATSITVILAKELYFSKLTRLSQVAYYAADNGLMCATTIDDTYIDPDTGIGIFEYNTLVSSQQVIDKVNAQRLANGLPAIQLTDIKCATSAIFNVSVSSIQVSPFPHVDPSGNTDNGRTTKFNMKMNLGNGTFRCASIIINKTPSYRQIISRGFASCGVAYTYPIERAIISTAETAK